MQTIKPRKDTRAYQADQDNMKKYLKCVSAYNLPRYSKGEKIQYSLYVENFGKKNVKMVLVGYITK